jgi:signal transduction histidine kinase
MNKLWVRISLTYVAIVIFLIVIPSAIYLTMQADGVDPIGMISPITADYSHGFLSRVVEFSTSEIAIRLLRILLSISLMGMLIGVISSWGLSAPLNNLAKAARAVGSQDLTQRIEVKGTREIREVVVSFNAMAEALEEAEGLRSNMLADIAHELRTPLTVIQGNLRAILDDVYELDKVEVARLYDQTRQLSRLVEDLHDLALLEAREFSLNQVRLNLIEIIREVSAIYEPIIEDLEISLQLDLPADIPAVQGDPTRLTQCLNNLINNALTHTPPGGLISVQLIENEKQVEVIVRDNGSGIEEKHLPYVFDRFYRADPDRNRRTGGSGLGLAITEAIVQAHGGKISAASEGPGKGSEFIIRLPVIP